MIYHDAESIRTLHLEITNLCNASCPMCNRNIFGGIDRPSRGLSDWTKDDIDLVLSDDLVNLRSIYVCGTHGDPIASSNLFTLVEKAKQKNLKVDIFTNGSLRTEAWWHKFSKLFEKRDKIIFSVDGLETNHLYRQNTNIDKIISHIKICCDNGVTVRWDFLAFKHNEHELEKCQALAKELGVAEFRIRRTPRFDQFNPYPVVDKQGEITHWLEAPDLAELRHPGLDKIVKHARRPSESVVKRAITFGKIKNKSSTTIGFNNTYKKEDYKIDCAYKAENKIYVNSRLDVFPCCYISDDHESFRDLTVDELKYPNGEFNLRSKSWKEILDHTFYKKDLMQSFNDNRVIPRCIKTCGIVDRINGQNLDIGKI